MQIVKEKEKMVTIPESEYKALLRIKREGIQEIELTPAQKRAIVASEKELRDGKYFMLNELESYLERTRPRTRR